MRKLLYVFILCMAPAMVCGCAHFGEQSRSRAAFEEANDYFRRGSYAASLKSYERIIERYPASGDRALFQIGVIYAYPDNEEKDYRKSLESFQSLIEGYPASRYRHDGEMMIFYLDSIAIKDQAIAAQRKEIETLQQEEEALRQELERNEREAAGVQEKLEALKKTVVDLALGKRSVDRIVVEKKERRLTLMSGGEALKTYRIALGGDPNGPKEREGDNKTPEGTYIIDSRNKESRYHLSLHISYPNEKDKAQARARGVSPGGDIMIHGIKKGFSWAGARHAEIDWTKGCIAVTDEEIEEIDKLAPNGTIVEIRP